MLKEIAQGKAEELLKSMVIPPRPLILLQLEQAQRATEPDFVHIADLIASDLTLAAAVLKVVNSPFFGLRQKVSSVEHALHLLGLRNLGNIVQGVMLKQVLSAQVSEKMERFWVHALRLALVCAHLAEHIHGVDIAEAHTYGLFQDCGMPLMQARFPDYAATLSKCEALPLAQALAVEEAQHKTQHAVVGYLLGRTWFLPEHLGLAILNHHDIGFFNQSDGGQWHQVGGLIALAGLAGHIIRHHYAQAELGDWRMLESVYLEHLGMERTEYEDLTDQIHRVLENA